jgi:outer membrane protein assembly factor BamB
VTAAFVLVLLAQDWPRFRGPDGNAVSTETGLPATWSPTENVRWKLKVPGEGSSSPIVHGDRVYLTSALERGFRRLVHAVDRKTGALLWTREVRDEDPERSSALTGHAAATPATDGERVVASFGNAGLACFSPSGELLWRTRFGDFDSELGLASSPVLHDGRVFLVCDHDGDSFLAALDLKTGKTLWRAARPGLERSWSTPVVLPGGELVVNGQDELRAYHPADGRILWRVTGLSAWVAPSPVFAKDRVYATSGKDGPMVAVRTGGSGDVTASHVLWRVERGGPYVCSPLVHEGLLYVPDENGFLTVRDAADGKPVYRERLGGKFTASPVAAEGRVCVMNEEGTAFVVAAGREFRLLAKNAMGEECYASPAIARGSLFLRTGTHLWCIAGK